MGTKTMGSWRGVAPRLMGLAAAGVAGLVLGHGQGPPAPPALAAGDCAVVINCGSDPTVTSSLPVHHPYRDPQTQ